MNKGLVINNGESEIYDKFVNAKGGKMIGKTYQWMVGTPGLLVLNQ